MPDIAVKNNEPLHRLKDMVGEMVSDLKSDREEFTARFNKGETQYADIINKLSEQEQRWERVDARMTEMDKVLAKGSKVYLPIEGGKPDASETRRQFARWMMNRMAIATREKPLFDENEIKAYVRAVTDIKQGAHPTTFDDEGNKLVPDIFIQEIQRVAGVYGFVRRNFRIIPVAKERVYLPVHTGGPTVTWVDEGAAPADSTGVTFGRVELTTKRLMAIDVLTIEILRESVPMIADFLLEVFAEKLAAEEDRVGLLGSTGAGDPFNGVVNFTGVQTVYLGNAANSGVTAFSGLTYEDVVNTVDAPNEFIADRTKWVMNNSIVNLFRKVRSGSASVDTNDAEVIHSTVGMPLWGEMSAANPGTIMGLPYERSAVMNKMSDSGAGEVLAILGDFRWAFMGQNMETQVAFSEHADFARGNVVMRVMERVGFVGGLGTNNNTIAVLKAATS